MKKAFIPSVNICVLVSWCRQARGCSGETPRLSLLGCTHSLILPHHSQKCCMPDSVVWVTPTTVQHACVCGSPHCDASLITERALSLVSSLTGEE